MKKQILTLIIGILIGAIVTTGIFLILKGNKKDPNTMNRDNMPSMDGKFPGRDGSFPGKDGNFPGGERPSRNNRQNVIDASNSNDISSNDVGE